ncbi:hypothetical protein NDU88_005839 [Pleurodeles waltl]|uniref:Uncharacterized protein n=1 Tax=Pleurodeles waltl TaxID=8319 RepID=A0AAV7LQ73_PLEWA|nr:hypothetical protein NDU88_005839 [Pleurodeles waltl]
MWNRELGEARGDGDWRLACCQQHALWWLLYLLYKQTHFPLLPRFITFLDHNIILATRGSYFWSHCGTCASLQRTFLFPFTKLKTFSVSKPRSYNRWSRRSYFRIFFYYAGVYALIQTCTSPHYNQRAREQGVRASVYSPIRRFKFTLFPSNRKAHSEEPSSAERLLGNELFSLPEDFHVYC